MDEVIERATCPFVRRPEELEHLVDAEPRGRRRFTHRRPVAAPRPGARVTHEAGSHRVPDDVGNRPDHVRGAVAATRPRPVLEEVRVPAVAAIRTARVVSVQLLESC